MPVGLGKHHQAFGGHPAAEGLGAAESRARAPPPRTPRRSCLSPVAPRRRTRQTGSPRVSPCHRARVPRPHVRLRRGIRNHLPPARRRAKRADARSRADRRAGGRRRPRRPDGRRGARPPPAARSLVAEAKPTVGRKLLMAGKSGLNLTKAEPPAAFAAAYTARRRLAGADPRATSAPRRSSPGPTASASRPSPAARAGSSRAR